MKSEQIGELTAALSAAQGEFKPVAKTGKNPHLGNVYVTLDGIIDAVRKPLADHGLAFSQILDEGEAGSVLETTLLHTSGQWISGRVRVSPMTGNRGVNELQALGSALTYMKRYALAALLGIAADEDDDGNGKPEPRKAAPPKAQAPQAPPDYEDEQDESGEPFIDSVEFGCFDTKTGGKLHIGFMATDEKWPSVRWWKGREELIKSAPWIGTIATKDELGTKDRRWTCPMRVFYAEDDKGFKTAVRFQQLTTASGG